MSEIRQTVPHIAQAAAARWGDVPALIEHGETWSFAQLWEKSRAAASALIAKGIVQGDRVAIWAPNSREWVVAAIGAMTSGATIVPLNTRLKGMEAGDILRRTNAKALFCVSDFLGVNYADLLSDQDLPALECTLYLDKDFSAFLDSGTGPDDPAVMTTLNTVQPDSISDIIFTSGTTGQPKGVMMTYDRMMYQCDIFIKETGLSEGERYLIVNPFFHSFGLKVGWIACLLSGAVILPVAQFDVAEVIEKIEQEGVNFLPGPPTIFQMLLAERDKKTFNCSSLRGGTTGAATVPPILVERIREDLGMKDIITAYGMTECMIITSCCMGDHIDLIVNTCGKGIADTQVKIVGADGTELPRGEAGEIWVKSKGVMLGYLDDPEATAKAITDNGWLRTGDVGTMRENGYIRITDRLKDMFISGGFNVYPAEVEKLLSNHPDISMVAVIGVPDDRLGEVGRAFVVLRPDAKATDADLLAWSRDNMANYKVPRSFVLVDDLPKNASGKVLKTELRDRDEERS